MKFKIVFLFILFINAGLYATDLEYVIVQGNKVRLRKSPSVESKIVRELYNNEFVFYLDRSKKQYKIHNVEHSWYKVKTRQLEVGWVYGKYVWHLSKEKEPEKSYSEIVDNYICKYCNINKKSSYRIYNLQINDLKKEKIIIIRHESVEVVNGRPTGFISEDSTSFYVKIENKFYRVVKALYDSKYYFINNYIIVNNESSIDCYDRSKIVESDFYIPHEKVYKRTDGLYTGSRDAAFDCHIKFDEKSLIATMYLRYKKGEPFVIEKYKFDNGKFIKLESSEAKKKIVQVLYSERF